MNKTLFRMEWKSAWKLLLIFILILAMYFSIMLTMFDPELGSALAQFEKLMPEMMAAVGMSGTAATLVDFFLNLSVWHDHDYVPVFVFCYSLPATACQKGG